MNRSAYFTTGFAIKALADFSRADVVLHGEENIPKGPTIFVINHFTRIETILIPYYIYHLTGVPVFSLASHELFKGGLKRFFDLVGVISTRDPNRDKIILRGLLAGSENWIIFPEGRMVKTKKIMGRGEFLISHSGGVHKPHTGAASLAMRAEFYRHHLLRWEKKEPQAVASFLHFFDIESLDDLRQKATSIVPVNLTYYPIRAKENVASYLAGKMVKGIPEQMIEEIMTEGTMLLSGVDLDIHFGKPLTLSNFLEEKIVTEELEKPIQGEPGVLSEQLSDFMHTESTAMMEQYMRAIYDMTTINHEHLFASFVKLSPYRRIKEMALRRKVYYASLKIGDKKRMGCNLHHSLEEDQTHLITDDRYKKIENFIALAVEKGVLRKDNGYLIKIGVKISDILQFHRGRIDNPIEVMANEVEPLKKLQKLILSLAFEPDFLIRIRLVHFLLQKELEQYTKDGLSCSEAEKRAGGAPYLLHGSTRKIGVVLLHSYLAVPEEVRSLARYLNRQGLWVYAPRLAGHGTTPHDLAARSHKEWQLSAERGYAILSNICENVVVGGVSVGGCLALELASRLPQMCAVFAVCPPLRLKDYSTTFMPTIDVWDRIVARLKGNGESQEFFSFDAENPYINYDRNPATGVREIGRLLEDLKAALPDVQPPSLILHAAEDPVVNSKGSKMIYAEIGSQIKEYVLLNYKRHIIVNGEKSARVHELIADFIRDAVRKSGR